MADITPNVEQLKDLKSLNKVELTQETIHIWLNSFDDKKYEVHEFMQLVVDVLTIAKRYSNNETKRAIDFVMPTFEEQSQPPVKEENNEEEIL